MMPKNEKYLILAMFVYSGVEKILDPSKDARRMEKRVGVYSTQAMQVVGVFEIIASLYAAQGNILALRSLALFTVLATLIFYTNPIKPYPVLSNAATLGALLLMTKCKP